MSQARVSTGWLTCAGLVFAGFFAAVLIAEIGLRLLGIEYPEFWQRDYYVGGSLRPYAQGWQKWEGRAFVQINSDGLRDREHAIPKPANTLRIAVLGDSFAEALQVPMEETFWHVMERELVRCPEVHAERVEVINFGVSDYGTTQEFITLRRKVWKYSPDIVLLAFYTRNDICNNSPVLEPGKSRPFFELRNRELVLNDSFHSTPGFRLANSLPAHAIQGLANYSRILQLAYKVRRFRLHPVGAAPGQLDTSLQSELLVYAKPEVPAWSEAWAVTEAVIVAMYHECKVRGVKFVLVTLSNQEQVNPDRAMPRAISQQLKGSDIFYPERRITALGEREGFSTLTLAPALLAFAEQKRVLLHGFSNTAIGEGHWNALGHHIAGQIISGELCKLLTHRFQHPGQNSTGNTVAMPQKKRNGGSNIQ